MSPYETRTAMKGKWLAVAILLGIGYLAGSTSREATVQADGRRGQAEAEHFQSGAQRSEILLREISATLGKMDARLDRMERLATRYVNSTPQHAPAETRPQ